MNIFEIIASNPGTLNMNPIQNSWCLFRANICEVMKLGSVSDISKIVQQGQQLWAQVCKSTPQIIPIMLNFYKYKLSQFLTEQVLPELNKFKNSSTQVRLVPIRNLHALLTTIYSLYRRQELYVQIFKEEADLRDDLKDSFESVVKAFKIEEALVQMIWNCFVIHSQGIVKTEMIELVFQVKDHVDSREVSKGEEVSLPEIQAILECLLEIGILNEYLDPFYHKLNRDIEALFQSCDDFTCKDDFLTRSINYSRTFQKTFMKGISNPKTKTLIEKCYSGNLQNNCYFLCGKFCAKNILDIILGFPDSRSTIIVLKKCLDKTSMVNEVAQELIKGVEARLLIPGVITDNILTQYINMLKILQIIDPQGIIFERITQPVKTYLLKRNDTLRCIIAELTEDKDNYEKLTTEVLKIPSNREFIDEMSSNEDEQATEKWEIVPSKNRKRIRYQESDLVTVLVNLYGSQEAFIGEYQSMMAEKFISVKQNNLQEEITNIELLKKRFGQSALHICNIIIKDIKDSKKIDNVIHKQSGNRASVGMFGIKQLNCLTVSKGYWPINYDNTSNFNMPLSFSKVFEEYVTEFSKIQALRKNYFHFNLGSVDLSLTFDNGKFDFKCLPIQAMMITFFDEDKIKDANLGVSSQELSVQLQIPQNVVKQKMSFWVHKGVVKEVRMPKTGLSLRRMNSIEDGDLVYYKPVKEYHQVTRDEIDELDVDNAIMKESTSMESHLRHIIEGLIISILNINGPKPCEKIHLLLKTIYKTDLDYTYQEAQTNQILKKMVQKKKIHFDGSSYASKS